jgi:hypothetical protein
MRPSEQARVAAPAATVFPLALTPFEYYYYSDDCAEYPTTFPVELRFSGSLVREHFLAAHREAVRRHPMLRAVVDDSGKGTFWVADQRREPHLDWQDASAPVSPAGGECLDLRSMPGLRTWVRASGDAARVLFQFHHACCDGLAALQFVQDFLALYKIAAGVDDPPLRELDAELLRRRGELAGSAESGSSRLRAIRNWLRDSYVTARLWSSILFRSPAPLAAPTQSTAHSVGGGPHEILTFETEALDSAETAQLHRVSESLGVTINDLLLRDFLLVLDGWNKRHSAPPGRLRLLVPVSVRTRHDARLPAADRIGFGFVTATARDRDAVVPLLDVVLRETQRIKDWKLALYFLGGLAFASRLPWLLRWALRRNRPFATAVLSNVGRFAPEPSMAGREERWACGELVLTRITGVPPLRRLTRAAVIVAEYAGETVLCLRCDPHSFTSAQTHQLLNEFAARVRDTLRSDA